MSTRKDLLQRGGRRSTFSCQVPKRVAVLSLLLVLAATAGGQSLDPFNPNASGLSIGTTASQPDGKIIVGGSFSSVSGVERNSIARFNADGTLDTAFNPNVLGGVYSIVVQADGKILIGGNFHNVGGQTRNHVARLDATTGLPDSFNPNANGEIKAMNVQPDGKILVGGWFHAGISTPSIGGQPRNYLARLDPVTGLADSFDPNPSSDVSSIVVRADGKILTSGFFASIGGQSRNGIAQLDPITGFADSFNPNPDSYVLAVAVQPDGKVLAGGRFDSIGGQVRSHIARLDGTTGLADSFDPNAGSSGYEVTSIVLQANGQILAGGPFVSIGGQDHPRIVRLDPATGLADSFNPKPNIQVNSVMLQADGKIVIGGRFTAIGVLARGFGARFSNNIPALQELAVAHDSVTWTCGGSSPQFTRVTFESSTDSVNYNPLGHGMAAGSSWTLSGLSLPIEQNIYVRARGYYHSGYGNGSQNIAEIFRKAFLARPGTLGNISTRLRVLGGDNALIGGLIATGTGGTRVILRAIGPSLIDLGVPGALEDPTLELFQGSTLLMSNDDWQNSSQQVEIAASGFAPGKPAESAIIWTLTPGQGYTAIVRGKNATTGVGVVEAYDLDHSPTSKLGNISTRGFVDVDNNVMIAGVIVGPPIGTNVKILARALGPSLSDLGVPGALADPTIELVNSSGTVVRSNNNWQDDSQQRALIEAAGLGPGHIEEAALMETVAPGAYTAIVRGSNRTTGVGLAEVYHLP